MTLALMEIAAIAHEANKVWCDATGDNSQPHWIDAPDWQKTSAIKGVVAILDNPEQTPEKSHEGWLENKLSEGWKYGAVKDPEKKEHPCMVPYSELPEAQRVKDEIFTRIVKALAPLNGREEN